MARRLIVVLAAVAGGVGLLSPAATAGGVSTLDAESRFSALVDGERTARGLAPLSRSGDLVAVARRHSQRMADQQRLHHNPSLATEVSGWRRVGENVGRGIDVDDVHEAFMASASHRANILHADFAEVGVGVVVHANVIWVTEVFRQPTSGPAPPPPPPADSTTTQVPPPTTAAPATTTVTTATTTTTTTPPPPPTAPPATSRPAATTVDAEVAAPIDGSDRDLPPAGAVAAALVTAVVSAQAVVVSWLDPGPRRTSRGPRAPTRQV